MNVPENNNSQWIVDTTAESFELDVVERSKITPVVVDFWAPWCAPCRVLGPLLEKTTEEYGGQFVLVRANTDELSGIAVQFQVQSIPTVFAFVDGEVVEFFQGVLPEDQLREWIDKILLANTLVDARALEASDPSEAERLYRKVIDASSVPAAAQIGLARVLLSEHRLDETREIIDSLEERGFLEVEAEKIKATLELRTKGTGDVAESRAAVAADPDNLTLQVALAEALAGQEQFEEALEVCLRVVANDKAGVGEQARQVMVGIFHALPNDSELTRTYRRKLSSLLF